ncbi:FecR family protein [uncultured Alistipes sp.]|uniref:FecR family protein n=1 Tax=uncultured Alistipes sp. TaxID=538949 RepID=UPI0025CC6F81|nr:FecR family protein [uncultured Alistipes sp.]
MDKELLYKYICGRTSEEEERAVTDWLRTDPRNQEELNGLWFVQNTTLVNTPRPERKPLQTAHARWYRMPLVRRCMQTAAALLLLAGTWYASRSVVIENTAKQYLAISAPTGQRIDITLHDGTTVCLNSGAKLEYPMRFGKTRRVKLFGEAMFDVDHDASRPFIVETFACDVEVLGTKFNVATDEKAHSFSAALLRGKLRVTNKLTHGDQIVMNTNDFVSLNGDRLALRSIENTDDYLWPEGILNLAGHNFAEVVNRLENLYGVKIAIERTENPELNVIRGKIPVAMGLDYALRALQKITPFEYEQQDNNTITIR